MSEAVVVVVASALVDLLLGTRSQRPLRIASPTTTCTLPAVSTPRCSRPWGAFIGTDASLPTKSAPASMRWWTRRSCATTSRRSCSAPGTPDATSGSWSPVRRRGRTPPRTARDDGPAPGSTRSRRRVGHPSGGTSRLTTHASAIRPSAIR